MRFVGLVIIVVSLLSTVLLPLALGSMQLAAYSTVLSPESVGDILHHFPTAFALGVNFYLSPVGAGFLGLDCLLFVIGASIFMHRPQSVDQQPR